ncbi:HAT family dimerization domain containing protein, partial [Trifolium medium]|nr:HAT family dimerization domain containing protein [Trifolium medium]
MLEILATLQEVNDNGGKRKGDEVVVGRSRDRFKRTRVGSQDSVDNKETLSEEAHRADARFFYNNVIPFEA